MPVEDPERSRREHIFLSEWVTIPDGGPEGGPCRRAAAAHHALALGRKNYSASPIGENDAGALVACELDDAQAFTLGAAPGVLRLDIPRDSNGRPDWAAPDASFGTAPPAVHAFLRSRLGLAISPEEEALPLGDLVSSLLRRAAGPGANRDQSPAHTGPAPTPSPASVRARSERNQGE